MQRTTPNPLRLGLFWLGIQVIWGALLGISLQARSNQLGGAHALVSYGELATAGAIVAAIVQIAVGPFADARRAAGSRRIEFYTAGTAIAAIAVVWFYLAPTFATLVAAFMLLQFAMNVATGPYQAVIPDYVSSERAGSASSWMAALQGFGNAIGAVVASVVANALLAGATLAALLGVTCALTVAHIRTLPLQSIQHVRLRITRPLVDLVISRALLFTGFYTLLGYLYFYVAQLLHASVRESTLRSGELVLAFTVVGAIGAFAAARPVDRADKRAVVTVAGAFFVFALLAFIVGNGWLALLAAVLVAGVAWGAFLTADWALGCELLPQGATATAMGIWNLAVIAPQIIAPALTTAILVRLHASASPNAPRLAFAFAAVEVVLGIIWIWRLPARRAHECESA